MLRPMSTHCICYCQGQASGYGVRTGKKKTCLQELLQHIWQEDCLWLLGCRHMCRVSLCCFGITLCQPPPCLVQLLVSMELQLQQFASSE